MRSKTSALRLQVEASLAARVASPFEYHDRTTIETVPTGAPPIDQLTGGLPRGSLTEIYGPPCSGRTSLLISVLASRTSAPEVCALIDARDAFDPHTAEATGVKLEQLLWVRCRNIDQALRTADLLIQGGGFGLIALDLGDTPPREVRYVPLQVWFRFRRAVEHTPTIFLVVEQESNAKTCASLVLSLRAQQTRWSHTANANVSSQKYVASFAGGRSFSSDIQSPLLNWLQPLRAPKLFSEFAAHDISSAREISWHSPGCLLDGWKIRVEMIRSHADRAKCNAADFSEAFLLSSVHSSKGDFRHR
jgi:recombination protein RecA